jgi:RNA polymerase sigma factor (sigma-70 family)
MEKLFKEIVGEDFNSYYKKMNYIKSCYYHSRVDNDEVYNDAMIILLNNIEKFNPELSQIDTWFSNIFINRFRLYIRRFKMIYEPFLSDLRDDSEEYDNDIDNQYKAVKTYLKSLNNDIINLWLDDVKYKDIAEILNVKLSKVKNDILQAKKKCKKEFGIEYKKRKKLSQDRKDFYRIKYQKNKDILKQKYQDNKEFYQKKSLDYYYKKIKEQL